MLQLLALIAITTAVSVWLINVLRQPSLTVALLTIGLNTNLSLLLPLNNMPFTTGNHQAANDVKF